MCTASYDTEEKSKKSRWGKKVKVEKERTLEIEERSSSLADKREEAEAESGRKKGKSPRQQFEGPQAKVVFHHFSADSAEDVLKIEGESGPPPLNSEEDVMIKVEVRCTVLLFKP